MTTGITTAEELRLSAFDLSNILIATESVPFSVSSSATRSCKGCRRCRALSVTNKSGVHESTSPRRGTKTVGSYARMRVGSAGICHKGRCPRLLDRARWQLPPKQNLHVFH